MVRPNRRQVLGTLGGALTIGLAGCPQGEAGSDGSEDTPTPTESEEMTDTPTPGETVYTVFAGGYLTPDDEPADEAFELTVAQDANY